MDLHERLRAIAKALPTDSASVTFTRADLIALLRASQDEPVSGRDLTIAEVAVEVTRAPSTIRGWLIAGALRGYKLDRRDWRVPRTALAEYLEGQRNGHHPQPTQPEPEVDIRAWRRLATPPI